MLAPWERKVNADEGGSEDMGGFSAMGRGWRCEGVVA